MASRVWRGGIIGGMIVLAICATGKPAASQSCIPPPEGLVSWWAAEGNAIDSLGPNHGMVWNGVNFSEGVIGRAFSFDGVNDYAEVPDAASLNSTNALTIEAWINPHSLSGKYPVLVKKAGLSGGRSSTTHGYSLEFLHDQVIFGIYVGTEWALSPLGTVPIGTNIWSHVAATYDGTWVRMYINGAEVGDPTYKPGTITPSDNPLNIGRDPANPGDPDRYFDGLIDEVRIYNRALTKGEIGSIYQSGGAGLCQSQSPSCVQPDANLVSWWPADGDAEDFVGMNVGALVNGATFAPGFVGQAFSLDGVNDFIEIPDAPDLNLSSAITIQAWINPRSLPTLYPAIVKKSGLTGGSSTTNGYSLEFLNGQVIFGIYVGTGWALSPPGPVPIGTNTWSHVTAAYDGTWIRMYINGTEVGPPTYKPGNIIPSSDNPLNLGRDPGNPEDPDRYFDGLIDELMIYDRALTAGEIRTIYQAKEAGVCKNHPPKALCQNVTVPAGPACAASASIDNGSYDPEGDAITLTQSPGGPYPLGSTLATLTVAGVQGVARQCEGTVTVVDTTPPSLVPPQAVTSSREPENPTCGVFISDAQLGEATVHENCTGVVVVTRSGVPVNNIFPVGTTTLTHTATDASGNTATATQTVTVTDSTTPEITGLSVSPDVLWPANGKMVDVWVSYDLKTNCNAGPMPCGLSVSSNETIDSTDYSILDAHHLLLRAKNEKGNDRIYTITVTCSGSPGPEPKSTTVLVPDKNDKGGKK